MGVPLRPESDHRQVHGETPAHLRLPNLGVRHHRWNLHGGQPHRLDGLHGVGDLQKVRAGQTELNRRNLRRWPSKRANRRKPKRDHHHHNQRANSTQLKEKKISRSYHCPEWSYQVVIRPCTFFPVCCYLTKRKKTICFWQKKKKTIFFWQKKKKKKKS